MPVIWHVPRLSSTFLLLFFFKSQIKIETGKRLFHSPPPSPPKISPQTHSPSTGTQILHPPTPALWSPTETGGMISSPYNHCYRKPFSFPLFLPQHQFLPSSALCVLSYPPPSPPPTTTSTFFHNLWPKPIPPREVARPPINPHFSKTQNERQLFPHRHCHRGAQKYL